MYFDWSKIGFPAEFVCIFLVFHNFTLHHVTVLFIPIVIFIWQFWLWRTTELAWWGDDEWSGMWWRWRIQRQDHQHAAIITWSFLQLSLVTITVHTAAAILMHSIYSCFCCHVYSWRSRHQSNDKLFLLVCWTVTSSVLLRLEVAKQLHSWFLF